jgi:hypothetical protein
MTHSECPQQCTAFGGSARRKRSGSTIALVLPNLFRQTEGFMFTDRPQNAARGRKVATLGFAEVLAAPEAER